MGNKGCYVINHHPTVLSILCTVLGQTVNQSVESADVALVKGANK